MANHAFQSHDEAKAARQEAAKAYAKACAEKKARDEQKENAE